MCLKHSQNVIKPEPPCTYGEAFTDVFDADSNSISEREPIRVQFQFKWPVSNDVTRVSGVTAAQRMH